MGGQALWRYISKFGPHILSVYEEPMILIANRIRVKAWLRKNTKLTDNSKINLVRRKEKKNFVQKDAILIDDYIKNTNEFTAAGGIGIHHTSYSNTISKLKRLGF